MAFLTTFLACLGAIGLAFLLWLASAGAARAHEAASGWVYPGGCCQSAATAANGDCAPISGRYITEESDGYHLNLPVGSHPKLKTKGFHGVIPKHQARPSGDFDFHLCIGTDGSPVHCFFVAPGSS